ncbi:MAG: hypothetical protein HY049_14220 [Acidobacteria bacterium]|nr:hypothetical protein [Acidobacteriota bacterium]
MDATARRLTVPAPLQVMDCALTILSLGRSAQNLRELRDHLASVPAQSISHHFHDALLRPAFDDPEYRNDFAVWARRQLHDAALAERLGVIDPMDYPDLEQLRHQTIDVVEDRLAEAGEVPQAARGHEFYFLKSQFVILDTRARATTPSELTAMIPRLSTGSIFHHFIEARRRQPGRVDDFSAWLAGWGDECAHERERLAAVDYELWSLGELRDRIAAALAGARAGARVP